jgi:hypothetical protein
VQDLDADRAAGSHQRPIRAWLEQILRFSRAFDAYSLGKMGSGRACNAISPQP